jgi:putative ABC transport system permease protein
MRVTLPDAKYPSGMDKVAFHRMLADRLNSLAAVKNSAIVSNLPFGGFEALPYELEGSPAEPGRAPRIGAIVASPGYFDVMHVNPRRGRIFTAAEGISGPGVVIVNESLAAKFWPGDSAIGKRLRILNQRTAEPWITVVGVVPDVLQNFHHPLEHDPLIYLPYAARPQREMFIVARTRTPAALLADAFRHAVQSVDENLAVYDVRTLEARFAQNRLSVKLLGGMFAVFAAIALLLATVGLYAVIAHSVSQRTQEIGLRMALGGTTADIFRMVYAQAMRPIAIGLPLGLIAAAGVTHVLRIALIGVSPTDPGTFAAAVLLLVLAAMLGCAIPARRAVRVDPIVALRYE